MTNLAELHVYLERLCDALGHMDRRTSLKDYCQGLILPIARKSVEPLAAHIKPTQVRAKHQSLHHFVAKSAWSDSAVLAAACAQGCCTPAPPASRSRTIAPPSPPGKPRWPNVPASSTAAAR